MKINIHVLFIIAASLLISCSGSTDSGDNNNNTPPPEPELIYFWFFDTSLPNDTELESIIPSFSAGSTLASLEFISSLSGYPDTDRNGSMERRNLPTDLNYRPEGNGNIPYLEIEETVRGLQVKQPFAGDAGKNTLIVHLPSDGYEDIVFSLAARDEQAANALLFDYSVAANEPEWTTSGLENNETEQILSPDEYRRFELDFTGISAADNNPGFKIRIRFDVDNDTLNNGDRVTFNNIAVDAVPVGD